MFIGVRCQVPIRGDDKRPISLRIRVRTVVLLPDRKSSVSCRNEFLLTEMCRFDTKISDMISKQVAVPQLFLRKITQSSKIFPVMPYRPTKLPRNRTDSWMTSMRGRGCERNVLRLKLPAGRRSTGRARKRWRNNLPKD